MARSELTIMIGGEAGQGLVTIGQVLATTLTRAGYHIVVGQSYMSRIRGGHNTYSIRAAVGPIAAQREGVDILVALDQNTLSVHEAELRPGALVLADTGLSCGLSQCLSIPYKELAAARYENTVALGVAASLMGLDKAVVHEQLAHSLKKQPDEVIAANAQALDAAWDWAQTNHPAFDGLAPTQAQAERLLMGGNDAIALGAMSAGVKFCAFYPMTPATSIALNLAAHAKKMGLVVEQAEDEIAAINMAIGASFAGAPAIVSTSGGGFALMGEGVSLAGMTETPLVIAVIQRPGPATGLPTRTEQADLELTLYAGHGEFPRAILAPGSVEECFHLTRKAFFLAEQSQGPVFILGDQYLADSLRAVEPFALDGLEPVRAGLRQPGLGRAYQRYAIDASGVSPRALPGFGPELVVADSDEHTADGHITEDLAVRVQMAEKRMRKLAILAEAVIAPSFEGPAEAELLLACWGSAKGPVREAAQELRQAGRSVATCHFSQVWPLVGDKFLERFRQAGRVVMVEGNLTGQLAGLIRRETGFEVGRIVPRYDGLPLTPEYILRELQA
ncbi:pyruvate flavodoxin/ferredoxin oxidoreductase domain protein [Desulfarculus baarsii DSM 2075]|uniref:Pyruvate flavodoxin/ferredoxin oxidoreductase domain protein n=1 Tax=Desulfarculus baarsii (strain ATCC 33931 / DSM 2075 / LMG 7858 / VKM B-1802 / 2st14) TaxID=644282 RepID=E1QFS0_DESB2|nr:2-oxoacid:acceptor oxidoreductase subunit alpha [Desulfarculus baarsii]ADK84406.1 pyruvate flavodoxin/ferredoxin oxidoreductase domain protein [Desulfarculus baarsii DSM 2075]